MGELAQAAQEAQAASALAVRGEETFRSMLAATVPAMKKVMPSVVTEGRLIQLGMECFRKTPQLGECPPETIISALMTCSALGLEPSAVDGLGRAYVIPRKNWRTKSSEAQFELGYAGAIELMLRSGKVRDIRVREVHENDLFEYELGTNERLVHRPAPAGSRGKLTHVYLVALLPDGTRHLEVMDRDDIDRRRNVSPAKGRGPWVDHYEEMAKKTIVLYAFKWLPKSAELQKAMEADWTVPDYQDGRPNETALPVDEDESEPVYVEA